MADSCGSDTSGHLYQTNLVANQAVIGSSGGVLTTLSTANNAVYATDGSGVPSITTAPRVTSITFDGTNLLDTYTVGTWTPTIDGATPGTTTYVTQTGNYVKIGKLVIARFLVNFSAATGTGDATLGNLPFTTMNSANSNFVGTVDLSSVTLPVGTTAASLSLNTNATTGVFVAYGSAVAAANIQMENANRTYRGQVAYIATT